MKLANIQGRAALIINGLAVDIAAASGAEYGPDLASIYKNWDLFLSWALSALLPDGTSYVESDLEGISPKATQVFAIGLNYRAHAAESKLDVPGAPAVFTKYQTCLGAPFASVKNVAGEHDYEAELVIVIGREASNLSAADAWSCVAGVTVGQDYSERITQRASGSHFSLGKSFPGFGPTGPWLVTVDELDAVAKRDDLAISCDVSGDLRQSSRTSNMVFPVATLIEYLSSIVTLLPGDLIFTGTPEGIGYARKPEPGLLSPGDVVTTTIEGIGTIRQIIVA